ncbi:MAG: CotH kinase family protein [Bacteroidota bacterium]
MVLFRTILLVTIFLLRNELIYSQTNFTSSNLPIIIINTNGQTIKDEPKIEADMKIIDNGAGNRNYVTDNVFAYDGKIGIEIRGHSSQMFEKKQYGIETRDSAGNDIDVSLLGMPEESDWVLNSSHIDKTFLRNVLIYKFANEMGNYASRTKYCELVLNGDYRGIYILQEKIKRDKNRVDIKKIDPEDISGDKLTGGYIIHIDRREYDEKYWYSPFPPINGGSGKVYYNIQEPKLEDITQEQFNYIKSYVTQFETILSTSLYNDPFSGYYNYIDLDSFIDCYLLNEFSKNTDSYRLSAYFYKDRDSENGKLVMGPLWDFDISFGVADYDDGFNPFGWQSYKRSDGDLVNPFYTIKLMEDPVFINKLAKRWYELQETILSYLTITYYIDSTTGLLSEAVTRNSARWPELFDGKTYVWPNKYKLTSYQSEINYLKSWISQRFYWLNTNLSKDYSDIEWKEKDFSNDPIVVGQELKFHKSEFFGEVLNIDEIEFKSLNADVNLELVGDSLSIIVTNQGTYTFKGIGKKSGKIVTFSPAYEIEAVTTDVEINDQIANDFTLYQNYPNPFNPSTTIEYNVPTVETTRQVVFTTLKVYDVLGREVATLVNEYQKPGRYSVEFRVQNEGCTSGIYFYKLCAGSFSQTKKMNFIK